MTACVWYDDKTIPQEQCLHSVIAIHVSGAFGLFMHGGWCDDKIQITLSLIKTCHHPLHPNQKALVA